MPTTPSPSTPHPKKARGISNKKRDTSNFTSHETVPHKHGGLERGREGGRREGGWGGGGQDHLTARA